LTGCIHARQGIGKNNPEMAGALSVID